MDAYDYSQSWLSLLRPLTLGLILGVLYSFSLAKTYRLLLRNHSLIFLKSVSLLSLAILTLFILRLIASAQLEYLVLALIGFVYALHFSLFELRQWKNSH